MRTGMGVLQRTQKGPALHCLSQILSTVVPYSSADFWADFFLSPSTWNALFCIITSQGSQAQYGCSDFIIAKLFNCLSAGSCWTLLPPWLIITWYSSTLIISSEKFSLTYLLVGWMKCPSNCFPEFHVHLGFTVSYWWRRSEEVPRARTQKELRKSGQTGK